MGKTDKRISKVVSASEAEARLTRHFINSNNKDKLMEKVSTFITKLNNVPPNSPEADKLIDEFKGVFEQAMSVTSLDNHYRVGETTTDALQPLVMELCNQLIVEYDCNTPSEKTLAEVIAMAYIRIIRYSKSLNKCFDINEANPSLNQFRSVTSNELDRANRQYLSALSTLKQLKSPNIAINVNARAAFMANNQNINVERAEDENNKPK